MNLPLIRTTDAPASVYGVHGAAGLTYWTCLASRQHLASPTEAVEWASIPPSGLSGEHLHSRTEEIYLILGGEGEFILDGEKIPVRPGTLALTPVGHTHGLLNTGTTNLDWWVIETLAAATQQAIATTEPMEERPMAAAQIFDLTTTPVVETTGTFTGPLRRVERISLEPGESRELGRPSAETALFVQQGEATLTGLKPLSANTCVTLPAGSSVVLTASAPVVAYAVDLAIPGGDA
ncbi:cupin domain-containing protein [Lentzea nigeriaca]|uniref:cupin domain-containing protein n=1 Tax=Lentzea nigeriaca TaxID=1128665 RepID=UPI00195888C9|nr:cupin domain-containing protein [Lentzea nigeriaca]MBM7860896.1 mannose-6-phosphate isomerase-like protein (cupin superfamily) [Lentzea nigeriaca]